MRAGADGRPDPATRQTLASAASGPVDVVFGPDGALYYADFDGGTIRRIASTDSTPPSVSVTQPAAGATVSGTVSVAASASDNVGVVGVQFRVDGADLGAEDTTSPYQTSWDTLTVANGQHTLTAVARDAVGNTSTSSPVSVTVSNAPPPPGVGLVGAYAFNEASGNTVTDSSSAGNNGTLTGALRQAGRYGQALRFDSSGDWVTVNDSASLDLTSGMTVEAWVNPASFGEWRTVVLKQTTNFFVYGLYGNPSAIGHTEITVNGNQTQATGGAALPLNTWTHLAATYDGTALRLYRNATQVATFARSGAITTSTGPLRIGGNSIWPTEFFNGLVDEVRIYNRALTAAEITTDMNTPIGGSPPPTDTTPPSVSVTQPAAGATVSGTVSVAASASDNVGVVGVQFRVDGADLGAEDTTSPYQTSWDTLTVANGSTHADGGRARCGRQHQHLEPGQRDRLQRAAASRCRAGGRLRVQRGLGQHGHRLVECRQQRHLDRGARQAGRYGQALRFDSTATGSPSTTRPRSTSRAG